MAEQLFYEIPSYTMVCKLKDGEYPLDVWEGHEIYCKLMDIAPSDANGVKFHRDIIEQYKHFLVNEKKFPPLSDSEAYQIINGVEDAYKVCKKKSAEELKSQGSTTSVMTPSEKLLDA